MTAISSPFPTPPCFPARSSIPRGRARGGPVSPSKMDRGENIDAVQKSILESLEREPRVLKAPAPIVEVDHWDRFPPPSRFMPGSATATISATLSDIKKRVREALQGGDISAPVPVAAPAVAPWTPPAEKQLGKQEAELIAFSETPGGGGCLPARRNPASGPWSDRRGIGRNRARLLGQEAVVDQEIAGEALAAC